MPSRFTVASTLAACSAPITQVRALGQVHRKRGGQWSAEEEAAFRQPILDQFGRQSHPYYSSARLWDDGVIDPADTRRVLALGLSATMNAPIGEPKFGVFRM